MTPLIPTELVVKIAGYFDFRDFYLVSKYFTTLYHRVIYSEISNLDLHHILMHHQEHLVKHVELVGKDIENNVTPEDVNNMVSRLSLLSNCKKIEIYESIKFNDKYITYTNLLSKMYWITTLYCYGCNPEDVVEAISAFPNIKDVLFIQVPLNIHLLNDTNVSTLRLDISDCEIYQDVQPLTGIKDVFLESPSQISLLKLKNAFKSVTNIRVTLYAMESIEDLSIFSNQFLTIYLDFVVYSWESVRIPKLPEHLKMLYILVECIDSTPDSLPFRGFLDNEPSYEVKLRTGVNSYFSKKNSK